MEVKPAELLKKILFYTEKTQTELAKDFDVSFPTINSWILGKSTPRQSKLERIISLYTKITGDIHLTEEVLSEKYIQLAQAQQQYGDVYEKIMTEQDIYNTFLTSLTYHTNGIEGSTFNEPEVRSVLFDDVTFADKNVREHQEVKNHQAALGYVMRWIREGNTILTEEFIQKIHSILMNGIIHNAGQYRNHSVRIQGSHTVTSNHLSIEKHMTEFLYEVNNKTDSSIIHIAKTHALFEKIHPFSDGNGRIGRLLILILAFNEKLMAPIIKKEEKRAYYAYLQEAQMKDNHIPLAAFLCDSVLYGYEVVE